MTCDGIQMQRKGSIPSSLPRAFTSISVTLTSGRGFRIVDNGIMLLALYIIINKGLDSNQAVTCWVDSPSLWKDVALPIHLHPQLVCCVAPLAEECQLQCWNSPASHLDWNNYPF